MTMEEAGRAPRVRILIAEDQALVRRGTAVLLSRADSPIGAGWGLSGVDRLAFVCGGVLWVTGSGDSRFFADNPNNTAYSDGAYVAPAEDPGHLVQNANFTFRSTLTA